MCVLWYVFILLFSVCTLFPLSDEQGMSGAKTSHVVKKENPRIAALKKQKTCTGIVENMNLIKKVIQRRIVT